MIDFKDMPKQFTFCSRKDCPRRMNCLHWIAYMEHPVVKQAYFYDHRWIDENGGTEQCPCYTDSTPVAYARGFVKLMRTLPRAKAEELRSMLVEQFGLYNYYRYRRGEFLMTPEIQERITRIASELGIGTPLVFDSIEGRTHWGEQKVKAVL